MSNSQGTRSRVDIPNSKSELIDLIWRCLKALGETKGEAEQVEIIAYRAMEKEMALAALRRICADHGDNDWANNLHLSDIIEKHLGRHLDNKYVHDVANNWGFCKDCEHKKDGYCVNDTKISENYGQGLDECIDMILYDRSEGGGFMVGDFFGCVHFSQRS